MAKADARILRSPYDSVPSRQFQTEAGATQVLAGEFVKLKAAASPYVIPLATLDLTIGTDTACIGLAVSDSNETASADGVVDVYVPLPGIVYRMAATTSGNADTQAKIDALANNRVVVTLASGVYTLDENATDDAANAFYIVGGDPSTQEIDFTLRVDATYLGV